MTTAANIPQHAPSAMPMDMPHVGISRDWLAWATAVGVLLVMYLLLQNPYWVPAGDSEVYTGAAVNLAIGRGNIFSGLPVTLVPPGWALFMARIMKVFPTFLALKLATMSLMLGSLAIAFWICRRFTTAWTAALVIVLTGTISYVYALTFWLHSDALFCFLSSWALLLAFQIREGKCASWRGALMISLLVLSVLVRWAGLLSWLMVAAALLHGELRPRINRHWTLAVVSGLATLLAFFAIRQALKVPRAMQQEIRASGVIGEETQVALPDKVDTNVATTYQLVNPARGGVSGWIMRIVGWGNWVGYLLWQPLRLGRSSPLLGLVTLAIGWVALAPLFAATLANLRARQWIWPALLIYSFGLAANWPLVNARYLVPIAPFVVLGIFKGMEAIRNHWPKPAVATTVNVLLGYFIVSMFLCNGLLWAADAWVARSDDFYNNYEAGINRELIAGSHWLSEHNARDGQIAVTTRYTNLGHSHENRLGARVASLLTGRAIVTVPDRYVRRGDPYRNVYFVNWARALGIKYVLYQPEVSPWRLFHFRVGFLQELMTDQPAEDVGAGWRLYEIPATGDDAKRVRLTPIKNWPTRVPGI